MKTYIFKEIISPNVSPDQKLLTINDDKIWDPLSEDLDETFSNYIALPGFIDIHIHGSQGFDVMDLKRASLEGISQYLVTKGVTSFLATTVTAEVKKIDQAIEMIKEGTYNPLKGARCLGSYLEGPFLSPKYKGAHSEALLMHPNQELIKRWYIQSEESLKVVALAPELEGALEMVDYLVDKNVVVALGHSDGSYEHGMDAIRRGASLGVHLCNGMRPMHHRSSGLLTSCLLSPQVYGELILDGVHVDEGMSRLLYQNKKDHLILISDCMCAGGLSDGTYNLGPLKVLVKDKIARVESGSLAGSTLNLLDALKRMMKVNQLSLRQAIPHVTSIPAEAIKIQDDYGSLEKIKKLM